MTTNIALPGIILLLAAALPGFAASAKKAAPTYPTVGSLEPLDPLFNKLIAPNTKIEKLADGFQWCEGPVWSSAEHGLLFSDIPRNVVLCWKPGAGISEYLKPSGYTGKTPRGGEQGSNGLVVDSSGRLVLCQHGDRAMARLERDHSFTILAEYFQYRRLNSPNDAVYRANGDLYFTDPPYGLEKGNDDPRKELIFSGVFRLPQNDVLQYIRHHKSSRHELKLDHLQRPILAFPEFHPGHPRI